MNIKLAIDLKYLLNFKPILNNSTNLLSNINNKIYCKNLLIFVIFLEFFLKNHKYFSNLKLVVFKKKKKLNSFLRAPNKHKKAQISLCRVNYYLYLRFNFKFKLENINLLALPIFFFNLLKSINFFESTLISMKVKKVTYGIFLKNLIEL